MSDLAEDVRQVQNPALGAFLQWRLAVGYQTNRNDAAFCPMPLMFLVLSILLHEDTNRAIMSTRQGSGLRAFAAKFGGNDQAGADQLFAIHDRAEVFRDLSLKSLRIAIANRLIGLDARRATAALTTTRPLTGIPQDIRAMAQQAEKMGRWFGELTLHEIALVLKVRL